ncbi:MAG: DUF3435 domain-containing protein [Dehalococcoidia bacterium]|nr:DUF3435 domain-containing protein [Dehalococcoidia bacterium]
MREGGTVRRRSGPRSGRPRRRRDPPVEAEVPPERAELAERILALLRAEAPAGDLAREIAALRQVLAEVLVAEPDPRKLVSAVARLVEVEVRALRAQRLLAGTKGDDLAETLAQLVAELGLGGADEGG